MKLHNYLSMTIALIFLITTAFKCYVPESKNAHNLPADIVEKIRLDFPDLEQRNFVEQELIKLFKRRLNVGSDQLSRSILFLAKGDIVKFKELLDFDDPRDVLMEAEKQNGNPGHFFKEPFNF